MRAFSVNIQTCRQNFKNTLNNPTADFRKIKNSQPELKFTGSCKEKRMYSNSWMFFPERHVEHLCREGIDVAHPLARVLYLTHFLTVYR